MFKNRKRKKAIMNFGKDCRIYNEFLKSVIDMGYGNMTNSDLIAIGREDLVLKDRELKCKMQKSLEVLKAF